MRLNLATLVMLGLPAIVAAQPAAPATGDLVPLPPIGLPLPQIGLPLPPTGLPPATASPRSDRGANRPPPRHRRTRQPGLYAVPIYIWPSFYEAPVASRTPDPQKNAPAPPLTGRLQLAVAAGSDAQLYVDGYYMGTLADADDGVELETGPHAVEIRAPGFDPLRFSVSINPGRTITYRGTLNAIDPTPAAAPTAASSPAAVPPTPMIGYIIPGCYIGNVPPQEAGLPAGCDLSRVITVTR
jgi:hypothetical protein